MREGEGGRRRHNLARGQRLMLMPQGRWHPSPALPLAPTLPAPFHFGCISWRQRALSRVVYRVMVCSLSPHLLFHSEHPLLLCFLSFNLPFFSRSLSPGCFTPCFPCFLSSVPLPQWPPVLHYLLSCLSFPLLPPQSVLMLSSVFAFLLVFPCLTFLPPLLPVNPVETALSFFMVNTLICLSSPSHALLCAKQTHLFTQQLRAYQSNTFMVIKA